MPTATFLNLPPEKQERLMDAASREFASKPYNEASINRIIQEAGVPRGSFYMYFQDKEDLFRYLVQGYMDQMTMVLEEALVRQGGDVFAALLYLYDYITQKREAYDLGGMGAMAVIVGQNSGMQKNALLEMVDSGAVMARLREKLNPDLLDLSAPGAGFGRPAGRAADRGGAADLCRAAIRRRSGAPGTFGKHSGHFTARNGREIKTRGE